MDSLKKVAGSVESGFEKFVVPALQQPVVHLIISWLIILNVIDSIEGMPLKVKRIIINPVTKILALFIGLYYATGKVIESSAITIGIVLFFVLLSKFTENFDLINLTPNITPGCANVTVKDLLALFNGDLLTLKRTMYETGVPLDLELTDLNAPKIATYLINHNYKVTSTCQSPN
jgi:hypothetical protein